MILVARDVVASYPGAKPVLKQATCQLSQGTRLALLGANGSGKTTLLRCLSGAHKPDSGEIALAGRPL